MASRTEPDDSDGCISLPRFELDLVRRELRTASGDQAPLRRKALEALLVLAEQAGHVVGKDELIGRVWPDTVVTDDSLTQLINELRRSLGDTDRSLVRTVARRGYVLALPPAAAPVQATRPADGYAATSLLPPLPTATLVGRQADLVAVVDLVVQHRLVTIAGAGGMGKTTLALSVTHRLLERFAKSVWWVDLSVLSDAARVLPAIAAAVGIELKGDPGRCLVAELSGREILLVLDNCEHLVAEVAAVVSMLIGSAAGVKVLTTSQEPLKTEGERLYRLGALDLPPEGASLAVAMSSPAFQLFAQRATAIDQDFVLDTASVPLAIEICRHLDGVPLAIEMAAGRVPTLGVHGVHALLGDRLRVLRNARRMVPSRQETLRATLEWSCSLLNANELAVLRRASVFAGPFDATLAVQVAAEESADASWPLDALCALVDRSLIRVERASDPARYRLPESTRLLAREMLAEAGENEAAAQRHCRAMARLGLKISSAYYQPCGSDDEVIARYAVFYADLEQAFDHACREADADGAAAVLVGLRWLDQLRGDTESTQGRIERCLPLMPSRVCAARARVLGVIASCGWLSIEGFPAQDAAAAAVEAWRQLEPDPSTLGHALLRLATEEARLGRCQDANATLAEGRKLLAAIGNKKMQLLIAIYSGHVAMFCGLPDVHLRFMTRALKEARDCGASRLARYVLAFLPGAALMAGDVRLAISLGSEAAHEMRALRQRYYLTSILSDLVRALVEVGDLERARFEAVEALPLAWEFGHQADMARHVALMALRLGRAVDGATLIGYAFAQHVETRNAIEARAGADCDALKQLALHALGSSATEEALCAGRGLDHDGALALAGAVVGMQVGPGG